MCSLRSPRLVTSISLLIHAFLLPLFVISADLRIEFREEGGGRRSIELHDLDSARIRLFRSARLSTEEFARFFFVQVLSPRSGVPSDAPPLLGTYELRESSIVFEPRFPLQPGVKYRAVFDPANLPQRIAAPSPLRRINREFLIPKTATAPTTVVDHVYPSGSKLPENLLKFYLHFSAPMQRGDSYKHIRLLDSERKVIDLPFLELDEELWDVQGRRLTLFVDPGRIKKGLRPREEAGPVFEAGKSYTLVIDSEWKDANGVPLKEFFEKRFVAGPADETLPDPGTWKIHAPRAATRSELVVEFPEPLDHAMLHRVIVVTDSHRVRMAGRVTTDAEETRWSFLPDRAWQTGTYNLVVDTTLEDVAGNSIARLFEVDEFRPIERRVTSRTVSLPFTTLPAKPSK